MPPHPHHIRPWAVLGVAGSASFMALLDAQVLFVAFDDLRASFPASSLSAMSWTLSAYTIALTAAVVPAGRMTDRFGRRRTFMTGLILFTSASVLCALAPAAGLLVAFRVIQAIGAAALMPSSLALVLSVFPRERVPVAVATWGAIGAFAAGVGPTVGALLVHGWGWRAVFLANVPVGIAALVLALRLVPESREAERARFPDPVGIVLLAGALTLLALGIVQGNQWRWDSARTGLVLASSLVVLGWFVRRSLSVAHPALDLKLFASSAFRWANITTAVFTVGFTSAFFSLIQFMTNVWHFSVLHAGLAMAPGPLVVMVLAPQMGRLAARFGQRALLLPGGLLYAASGGILLSLDTHPSWATHLLPASLVSGLAISLIAPQLTSASVQDLPADKFGAGSAVNQAIRQFGATLGIALTVALLGSATRLNAVEHYQRVWWMLLACGLLTFACALALPRRRRARDPLLVPVPVGVAP